MSHPRATRGLPTHAPAYRRCFPEPSESALVQSGDAAQSHLHRVSVPSPTDPPMLDVPAAAAAEGGGGGGGGDTARDRALAWEQCSIWWDESLFTLVEGGGFRWRTSDEDAAAAAAGVVAAGAGAAAGEEAEDPRGVHWVPLTWVLLRWRRSGDLVAFLNTHYPVCAAPTYPRHPPTYPSTHSSCHPHQSPSPLPPPSTFETRHETRVVISSTARRRATTGSAKCR